MKSNSWPTLSATLSWTFTLALAASLVIGLSGLISEARAEHHEGEAAAPPTDHEVAIEWGAELFSENCASCHGSSGKGDGPKREGLKAAPSDLTTIAVRNGGKLPVVTIREVVDGRKQVKAHGTREMPVWGDEFGRARKQGEGRERAARSRSRALVSYLETIQEGVAAR
jgi:predicted CxxxxCH...CXXCH cytochrome family protein